MARGGPAESPSCGQTAFRYPVVGSTPRSKVHGARRARGVPKTTLRKSWSHFFWVLEDSLAEICWVCFRPIFGQPLPLNPSRTTGLVLQCRLHQKSARQTNSKATTFLRGLCTHKQLDRPLWIWSSEPKSGTNFSGAWFWCPFHTSGPVNLTCPLCTQLSARSGSLAGFILHQALSANEKVKRVPKWVFGQEFV